MNAANDLGEVTHHVHAFALAPYGYMHEARVLRIYQAMGWPCKMDP